MATREQLLDTFESRLEAEGGYIVPITGTQAEPDGRSAVIEEYQNIDGTRVTEWHKTKYWDREAQNHTTATFIVEDPGQASEEAYWHRGENPKPAPSDPTFQQEMQTWLRSQIDNTFGTLILRHIERTSADNAIERGTADVIMQNEVGDFVPKHVAIWQDAQSNWQFKVIQSA